MSRVKTLLALTLVTLTHFVVSSDVEFITLGSKIPYPVSDMGATIFPSYDGSKIDSDSIIITGGCSSPNGNEHFDEGNFYCTDVTDNVAVFYPSTSIWGTDLVPKMLRPRYRHCSVEVEGKLYVIGGRTLDDTAIAQIDVYDPVANDWSEHMYLESNFVVSDQACLNRKGKIYVMGGYDQTYNTMDNTFAIDVGAKTITELAPMPIKRGDASAVYVREKDTAYIMGGFTSVNGWCSPLHEGEAYDFDKNKWEEIPELNNNRGDKAVVMLDQKIYAIGGEEKHEDFCTDGNDLEPSSHAVAVDDVESFDPFDKDAEWVVETDFIKYRFRAAAAAWEPTHSIYIFGGQKQYSKECDCYPTADSVYAFRKTEGDSAASSAGLPSLLLLTMFMVAAI